MMLRWLIPTLLSLAVCLFLAWIAGFRINMTDSMPLGLYQLVDGPVQRGDMVALCAPAFWGELGRDRGYTGYGSCPDGSKPLLKILAGMAGDRVQVTEAGIEIGGYLQFASQRQHQDRHGRTVSSILESGTIPHGQALVLAPVSWSFDGRYFGHVPLGGLKKVHSVFIIPLGERDGKDDDRGTN